MSTVINDRHHDLFFVVRISSGPEFTWPGCSRAHCLIWIAGLQWRLQSYPDFSGPDSAGAIRRRETSTLLQQPLLFFLTPLSPLLSHPSLLSTPSPPPQFSPLSPLFSLPSPLLPSLPPPLS